MYSARKRNPKDVANEDLHDFIDMHDKGCESKWHTKLIENAMQYRENGCSGDWVADYISVGYDLI